jgi:surfeit locus 1 family protein
MKFRPLPILTIFTIPILIILFLLGNWQWGRYQFKLELEKQPPAPFQKIDMATIAVRDFQKYHLNAQIISPIIEVRTSENGKYGVRLFAIAKTQIGNIFYEFGFVPDDKFQEAKSHKFLQHIEIDVVSRISNKKPNYFITDNIPDTCLFYWVELAAMAKCSGFELSQNDFYFTPIQMDPLNSGKAILNPYADEKGATYVEPGRHLGYALTWWGLFISLIAVYVALHIKNGRLKFKS